jgi:Domain of Unknown Function (DUF349)
MDQQNSLTPASTSSASTSPASTSPASALNNSNPTKSPAAALMGDPAKFGRVDDQLNVYVKTAEGERLVGSYPDKTKEEALAYFVRKFEQVAAEVALLAARIKSGAIVPTDAAEAVIRLREQIRNLNGVGDLATLARSVDELPALIENHRAAYEERKQLETAMREAKKAAAMLEKEKIVSEAESLADSENWKVTSARLKELLDAWKVAPRLDKETDSALWKRFAASRNRFDKRRRTHFSQLVANQSEVAEKKNEIVATAKKLATSTDWVKTAHAFKDLMDQWKAAGRGKSSVDNKLWEEFKGYQDQFFAAKNADLAVRKVEMEENLTKREALILEFEAILPISDLAAAKKTFRDLIEKWSKIGITDRNKRASLETRINKVEAEIKALTDEQNRRTDPTAIAHATGVVKSLEEAIVNYEKQVARFTAEGQTAKAKVAQEAAEARKVWLEEARKGLSTFDIPGK